MKKTRISRQEVFDKVEAEGFAALTGPEFKAYSGINWWFKREGEYLERANRLLDWAKAVQHSQTLFETRNEFIKTVNRIMSKYKKGERNRLTSAAWARSLGEYREPEVVEVETDAGYQRRGRAGATP